MARGGVRGAFTAWLALIALQAVSTRGGSGRVAEMFKDLNVIVERLIDPKVPAIPDRRDGATPSPPAFPQAPAATPATGSTVVPAPSMSSQLPWYRQPS